MIAGKTGFFDLRGGRFGINPVVCVSADKSLKRTRYEFCYLIPDYEVMVRELADWIIKHKDLYQAICTVREIR